MFLIERTVKYMNIYLKYNISNLHYILLSLNFNQMVRMDVAKL